MEADELSNTPLWQDPPMASKAETPALLAKNAVFID
jgi:hypothetical protein